MVMELSCVEFIVLIKTPFFKRGKIGALVVDVVIGQELLSPRVCVFTLSKPVELPTELLLCEMNHY
jgi:hypothetical protein